MLQRTSTGKGDAAPTGLLSRMGTERGTEMQRRNAKAGEVCGTEWGHISE